MNPELIDIIRFASSEGISTSFDTNLSLKMDDRLFTELATCGLDSITVSLDGASRESYLKYRIGGDFDLVMSNIKSLILAKARANSRQPRIIWKFIVNRHNEHEIPEARNRARELGIEFFPRPMMLSDDLPDVKFAETLEKRFENWIPQDVRYRAPAYKKGPAPTRHAGACPYLFSSIHIAPDGKVFPCCYTSDERSAFGDLSKQSLEEIWNNGKYVSSRNLFFNLKVDYPQEKTVCSSCTLYTHQKDPTHENRAD